MVSAGRREAVCSCVFMTAIRGETRTLMNQGCGIDGYVSDLGGSETAEATRVRSTGPEKGLNQIGMGSLGRV